MPSSKEFYQCLICKKFLENLWKAESHISKHEDSSRNQSVCRGNRGRLPVQKVIFRDCYISLIKEKVNLESFKANLDVHKKRLGRPKGNVSKPSLEKIEANSSERPSGLCPVKVKEELTTYLNCKNHEEFIRNDEPVNGRRSQTSTVPSSSSSNIEASESERFCPVTTCSFKYTNYSAIAYHLKCHFFAGEKQAILTSGNPEQLKLILKRGSKHPLRSKHFYCKFCLSRELSLESLQAHLQKAHSEPKLNCPCCSEEFREDVNQLISHVKAFHQNYLYTEEDRKGKSANALGFKCSKCLRILSSQKALNTHIKNCHNPNRFDEAYAQRAYPCPHVSCPKRFKRSDQLRRHLEVHEKRFACDFSNCNKQFSHEHALRDHQKVVHLSDFKKDELKCKICGAIFSRKYRLRRHLEQVHDPAKDKFGKTYIFPRIKYSPLIKIDLEENKRIPETKVETIEEEIELVDKMILTEKGEAIHLKGEKLQPVNSSTSTLEIRTSSNPPVLVNIGPLGIRKYHKNNNKSFKCSMCHAEFLRAWVLQQHLKTVHHKTLAEKVLSANVKQEDAGVSLLCGLCAYPAKDKCDLENHMKSHGPIRKFKCFRKRSAGKTIMTCGKAFESEEGLNAHIKKVHDSEKKYKCEKCDREYSSILGFQRHINYSHNAGAKKHCKECDKYFSPGSYPSHMKRHKEVGSSKFKCLLCGDKLSTKRTLQQHIDLIHIGKSFDKKVQTSAGDSGEGVKTESTATYCDKTGDHSLSILGI